MRTEKQTKTAKANFLRALEQTLGVITPAAKKAKIDRSTVYTWMSNDPEFKTSVEDVSEIALDFAESALHKQINSGNATSTIFYLKTKGRPRGYHEFQEVQSTNLNMNTELSEEEKQEALDRVKEGLDEFKDYE